MWNDMENTEEKKLNSEKIGKIWKKPKLNSEKIWKIQKEIVKWYENMEENSEKNWKIQKKSKLNSEKIWKIQKKIVKRYGKYRRKVSWIVKRYGKYRRKWWNDIENMEENSEKNRKIQKKSKLNSEKIWKIINQWERLYYYLFEGVVPKTSVNWANTLNVSVNIVLLCVGGKDSWQSLQFSPHVPFFFLYMWSLRDLLLDAFWLDAVTHSCIE